MSAASSFASAFADDALRHSCNQTNNQLGNRGNSCCGALIQNDPGARRIGREVAVDLERKACRFERRQKGMNYRLRFLKVGCSSFIADKRERDAVPFNHAPFGCPLGTGQAN